MISISLKFTVKNYRINKCIFDKGLEWVISSNFPAPHAEVSSSVYLKERKIKALWDISGTEAFDFGC